MGVKIHTLVPFSFFKLSGKKNDIFQVVFNTREVQGKFVKTLQCLGRLQDAHIFLFSQQKKKKKKEAYKIE